MRGPLCLAVGAIVARVGKRLHVLGSSLAWPQREDIRAAASAYRVEGR